MRTHESYLRKKARASRKDSEGLGSRQIKCPKCHHDIAIAYDNLTAGNLELYCTVCHSWQNFNFGRYRRGEKE